MLHNIAANSCGDPLICRILNYNARRLRQSLILASVTAAAVPKIRSGNKINVKSKNGKAAGDMPRRNLNRSRTKKNNSNAEGRSVSKV